MNSEILAQASENDVCDAQMDILCDWVLDVINNEQLAESIDWLVERPSKVLFIFLVAFVVNWLVRRAIRRGVDRMVADREAKRALREAESIDDGRFAELREKAIVKTEQLHASADRSEQDAATLGSVLESSATVVIFSIAALIALGEFDINLAPLLAGAGVIGLALGFGARTVVRDFLAGTFMIIEDQYGVGDFVDLGDAEGIVEGISLRTTQLRDVEGSVWCVPNGEVRRAANKSQLWARAVLDIDVAYDTDFEQATRVIKDAASAVWREGLEIATILEEPEIWGIQHFGENAVTIRLVVKTEPGEQWAVKREIRRRIESVFDQEGIVIPFPQRVVWHASPEPAASAESGLGSSADRPGIAH